MFYHDFVLTTREQVIVTYDTDIDSKGTFYTDANGKEMQEVSSYFIVRLRLNFESLPKLKTDKPPLPFYSLIQRQVNYRPTWDLRNTEPISQNYYPVNTRIFIKDQARQFTVLTDRSVGGTSLQGGQVHSK